MRRSALIICTALALAVAGGGMSPALAAQPVAAAAHGGAGATAAGGPRVSVTLQLAQPRAAALATLAAAKGLARSSRLAQLGALLPSAGARAQVSAAAKAEGLTVVGGSPFSIVVSGPADRVRAVFGDSAPASPGGPRRDLRVPAAMSGLVGQVVGADGPTLRPLVFNPTVTTGPQAAAVYHTTTAPPVGGSSQTVATIQLSGWNPAALTQFAAANALPDPVASGQYTAIAVGSGSPTTPDGSGGDVEVALDQESILATAPHAKQRAYFGSNGSSDFFSAFNAVATDALSTAPDYHITALSVSWGGCEEFWSSAELDAYDSAMASLEAAGVEVFVASGDSGSYGCGQPGSPSSHFNSDLSVDFPASSPHAIGVGGTSLDHTTTPSAPVEHVWWHASGAASGEFQGDGTGGGYSTHFSRPSYQASVSGDVHRAVPDISLDGDPASGLLIKRYSGATLNTYQVGGTSLSAPLAAATYTDLLGSAGLSHGIGDIHAALYSAPAGGFRDVTVGSNGGYLASAGFDVASGLGAPLWTELGPSVLPHVTLTVAAYSTSTTIPISVSSPSGTTITGWAAGVGSTPADCSSATSGVPPTSVLAPGDGVQNVWVLGQSVSSCYPVSATVTVDSVKPGASASASVGTPGTFTWSATDAAPSSGLGGYSVTVTHAGGTVTDYSATTTATSWATPGVPGTTYAISVVAHDKAGNASSPATASFLMPASTYHAVDPYRVADTRSSLGGHGVLGPHASMTLAVVGGISPVPLGATAAALNVTATAGTQNGFLSVGPALTTTTSSVNFSAGETIPNLVFSKLSPGGTVTIYNGGLGSVQVVVDIEGYLSADATGSTYAALAPSRIMDTRTSVGVASAVAPHSSVVLQVTGGAVPTGSPAVALNVTVTRPTAAGFVSVAPAKSTTTSNLNFTGGATVANLVVTRLSTPAGTVTIYNGSNGTVHLIADVQGYFVSAATGSSFAPVAPYRVLDTRHAIGHSGAIAPNGSLVLSVVGGGSPVPSGAMAVIINVTAVNATRVGYLSVGPALTTTSSNLNFLAAEVRPNVVISRLSADTVTIYNGSTGTVDVLADVQGYLLGGS